jgi:IMP dehydrogenase/GMP reductase
MDPKNSGNLREALTFDDVLLKPGLSELLPSDADIRSRITRGIALNIPIIASAMDTVTEAKMAIAMAQAGGIGVIHRNLEPDEQAAQIRQVKKFEAGMGRRHDRERVHGEQLHADASNPTRPCRRAAEYTLWAVENSIV